MRLRASFTLENSVLIPLFTIIMVALCLLTFYVHDNVILNNSLFQTALLMNEQVDEQVDEQEDEQVENARLEDAAKSYINAKAIIMKNISLVIETKSGVVVAKGYGCFARIPFMKESQHLQKEVEVRRAGYVKTIRTARLINKTIDY